MLNATSLASASLKDHTDGDNWQKFYGDDGGELFPNDDFPVDTFKTESAFHMALESPSSTFFPQITNTREPFPTIKDELFPSMASNADRVFNDRLTSGWYMNECRSMESQLRQIRALILQKDTGMADKMMTEAIAFSRDLLQQWDQLKSYVFLHPTDFYNLQRLEEFLASTILSQLQLYTLDLQRINLNVGVGDVPVCLSITSQGTAGPVFKEKSLGPFTLRLLTGATNLQIQAGPVRPEIVEPAQRVKKSNNDMDHCKQALQENGHCSFNDLKFNSGTFPHLVHLKFLVEVSTNGQPGSKRIVESVLTDPYISLTNTGSQWKEAAASWLKEDCFKDAYEVPVSKFCNYLQKHYLIATKQDIDNIKRPLYLCDFEFFFQVKFRVGLEKKTISQKEFHKLWDWLGPSLKKLRYQKQVLYLFEQGFIPAFVPGSEAIEQLKRQAPGAFIVRLSGRIDGEFVVSYSHISGGVRHYMVQSSDTTDKKKTLIDFLGSVRFFTTILQLVTTTEGGARHWVVHQKDKILAKFYKKTVRSAKNNATNPYDSCLPGI